MKDHCQGSWRIEDLFLRVPKLEVSDQRPKMPKSYDVSEISDPMFQVDSLKKRHMLFNREI